MGKVKPIQALLSESMGKLALLRFFQKKSPSLFGMKGFGEMFL
jgi:hypothetical protein